MRIQPKMVIMVILPSVWLEWSEMDGITVVRSGIPSQSRPSRKRLVQVEMSPSYQIYDLELVGNLSLSDVIMRGKEMEIASYEINY